MMVLATASASIAHDSTHLFEKESTHSHSSQKSDTDHSKEHCYFCVNGPSVALEGFSITVVTSFDVTYITRCENHQSLHAASHPLPSLRGPPTIA